MLRKFALYMLLVTIIISSMGCSLRQQNPQQDEDRELEEPIQEPEKEKDQIEEKIKKMSIDEKVGQLVIVGIDGLTVDENTKGMIEDYYVGGIILFGRNVDNTQQLLGLINSLKEVNGEFTPLFISVDEEGGIVSRLPREFTKIPTSKKIGDKGSKELAFNTGGTIGEAIGAFGYNMNFAPVLDINSNPKNPVIGDRAYSSEAVVVTDLGIEAMKGLQSKGVIPVVKHFPGHGDTVVDSHISLPVVNKTLEALMGLELIPFIEAVKEGTDSIMVAHILYNKIDSENPATLSKAVLTDILREQLKFTGVIITDDLTMGAIVENYDIGDAAITSINAGSDIVLTCHGYSNSLKVLTALKKAVDEGIISEDRLNESVYRILKLKDKYSLNNDKIPSVDINKINSEITAIIKDLKQ